ncbi:hypothetical protein GWI33_016580 [Rhynchophorus ferrugineus]|uniref:Uncharacterized protein n=1 Tax=Rhynchophorus ferrugineus TaxID=354439 RepID=A0A834I390_RHYFE|nr:hypothetical protein GWI33_016580 [Rhynchophorus ferrugineus]
MPIKYIGRTTDFKGRIITRSKFERYPEPTYMKILKVEALPKPENESPDNLRKVRVLIEKTFRGKTLPKPILLESATYKPDYKLIPKDEEANFCKNIPKSDTPARILPRTMDFPPLMKELIIQEGILKGGATKEDLELEIAYNKMSQKSKYRIADKGEQPTQTFSIGLGTPITSRLYKGIDL